MRRRRGVKRRRLVRTSHTSAWYRAGVSAENPVVAFVVRLFLADRFGGWPVVVSGACILAIGVGVLASGPALLKLGLAVIGLGVACVALGLGTRFGAQARLTAAMRAAGPLARDRLAERAQTEPLPFWACSDCRVVEPGISDTPRCQRCLNASPFVQASGEEDRAIAVACLS